LHSYQEVCTYEEQSNIYFRLLSKGTTLDLFQKRSHSFGTLLALLFKLLNYSFRALNKMLNLKCNLGYQGSLTIHFGFYRIHLVE